jgi:hypothetical protein
VGVSVVTADGRVQESAKVVATAGQSQYLLSIEGQSIAGHVLAATTVDPFGLPAQQFMGELSEVYFSTSTNG